MGKRKEAAFVYRKNVGRDLLVLVDDDRQVISRLEYNPTIAY